MRSSSKAAETICRVMGGDLELCHEIERNNNFWKSVDGGEIMQRALIEPVEYKEEVSHRVYECSVRDALAAVVGGVTEVRTPSGMIDVLSDTEVIEVKYYIGDIASGVFRMPDHGHDGNDLGSRSGLAYDVG